MAPSWLLDPPCSTIAAALSAASAPARGSSGGQHGRYGCHRSSSRSPLTLRDMFLFCSIMGTRRPERDISFTMLPAHLRYGPPFTLGDAMVKGEELWLRCHACRHVGVIRPAVLAKVVGYDRKLTDLRRRLRCTKCGVRGKVRVETMQPGS